MQASKSEAIHAGVSLMLLSLPSREIEILMGISLFSNSSNIKVNIEGNNNVYKS